MRSTGKKTKRKQYTDTGVEIKPKALQRMQTWNKVCSWKYARTKMTFSTSLMRPPG